MRIVGFDLETTDLKALMGRILCCSFVEVLPSEGARKKRADIWTWRADAKSFRNRKNRIDDSKLAVAIRNRLEEFDMVVGWNSKLFDIPFLNARLAQAGHRPFHPHFNLDLMWYAGGSSLRIGSKKLDNVQKFFGLSEEKTPIAWKDWQNAAAGDKAAMDQVVLHCEADVRVLREAYWKLLPYVSSIHR